MRFNFLLGLILCVFSIGEINASTIKKDSINPLYPDLIDGYQLKIKNLEVIRSMGKNVKLKYDVVNTGKHIVKLGKGRAIPNTMSIIFDDSIESNDMSKYKAQIAEQILSQNLFIQSGKSALSNEVKVNLNAPAKLAHLIGNNNDGARIADHTMDKVKNGIGKLGKRNKAKAKIEAVDAIDMDIVDANVDAVVNANTEINDLDDMDQFGEVDGEMEIEKEVPSFSKYTEKVTEIEKPKPANKVIDRIKKPKIRLPKKKAKKVETEVATKIAAPTMLEKEVVTTEELTVVNGIDETDFETATTSTATIVDNAIPSGSSIVKKPRARNKVESTDVMETPTITKTKNRISANDAYPENDSILAIAKKKRQAKREAAKKDAMEMKANAEGSEVYDMEPVEKKRELTAEELDTSENLETEGSKWYEGFKPYAGANDFEENQTYVHDESGADEFLDKSTCPDLTLNDLKVVKSGKKWATVEFVITNVGKGPAMIYGTTSKEADNVYIKAHLSGSKKVSRGATTLGGMFVNRGVSNKAGKLMPDESMPLQMKIDIRKKTKFTSVLILDLDAFGNCRECDETNNKQHVVLK